MSLEKRKVKYIEKNYFVTESMKKLECIYADFIGLLNTDVFSPEKQTNKQQKNGQLPPLLLFSMAPCNIMENPFGHLGSAVLVLSSQLLVHPQTSLLAESGKG